MAHTHTDRNYSSSVEIPDNSYQQADAPQNWLSTLMVIFPPISTDDLLLKHTIHLSALTQHKCRSHEENGQLSCTNCAQGYDSFIGKHPGPVWSPRMKSIKKKWHLLTIF